MNEENAVKTEDEEPRPGRAQTRTALFRAPSARALPRYVGALAVLAACAFGWLATEAFLPAPRPAGLEVLAQADDSDPAVPPEASAEEVRFSETTFSARKLFIPETPVESKETSAAAIDEMLEQLKLIAVFEQDDEHYALVQVSERAPSSRGTRYPARASSPSEPSRTEKIRKGDHILDFEVEEIAKDSVELSVARFKRSLHF